MNVGIGTMIGNHASVDSRHVSYKDSPVQATNHKHDSPYHSLSIPFVRALPDVPRLISAKEVEYCAPSFIAATTFGRRKPGYKFGTSEKGTGYSIDYAGRLP